MNIEITLNQEQESALNDLVSIYNSSLNEEERVTVSVYLETILMGIINDKVKKNFEESAENLVALAKSATYEKRLALIELVRSELS